MPAPGQPEGASFPGEFIPAASGKKCDKAAGGWGIPMTDYEYIWYGNMEQSTYPVDACRPYHHLKAKIDSLQVDTDIRGSGGAGALSITSSAVTFSNDVSILGNLTVANFSGGTSFSGSVTAPTFVGNLTGTASGNKVLPFDIPHVTQKGKRIRHIIAEGPEAGIYVRGKIKDTNIIELPEYWDGLIDPETITVTLTQIGYSQDLIVDKIDLGKNIIIRSGSGTNIHCYYEVWASRWINPMNHDEKLIVVYDGETPDDYPGDNKQFLIGGWDYDRRNPYWEPLDKTSSVVL